MKYLLKKQGPYIFVGNSYANIFDSPVARKKGVYFWTINYSSSFLINYIGITTKSFEERFAQHLEYFYSGKYTIYNPTKFINGEKEAIYKPNDNIKLFVQNFRQLAYSIDDNIRTFKLFLFPLDETEDNLKMIESILISKIKEKKGLASSFLDNERVSKNFKQTNTEISIEIDFKFIGLDSKIIV